MSGRRFINSRYVDEVDCPKCKVARGSRCRSLTTDRVTDTHVARWDLWWRESDARAALAARHARGEA